MRAIGLVSLLLTLAPGCITLLAHRELAEPAPVGPREVNAVRDAEGRYHLRVHYADAASVGWVRAPAGGWSKVPAGPLPDGERVHVGRDHRPPYDGQFVVRDGARVVDELEELTLQVQGPVEPWGVAAAWALTPFTACADVATCWLQLPLALVFLAYLP